MTEQSTNLSDWEKPENFAWQVGTGNWKGVRRLGVNPQDLLDEAARWADGLRNVELPWLCWNVDNNWSLVQQRLVAEVGWTPVVGFDPRVGAPPLIPGAVLMDFNAHLKLPTMWMHFPMEFIFLFCPRLAFWHADCLVRIEKLRKYAAMFAALPDGEMAAVRPVVDWRARLAPKRRRYWEVIGCSTAGASRSQFEHGCGWWMNFSEHPSTPVAEHDERSHYYWDCGVGIRFWEKKCGGQVRSIPEAEIAEGHFTLIGRSNYKRASPVHFKRDLSKELSYNNDLEHACRSLELTRFL